MTKQELIHRAMTSHVELDSEDVRLAMRGLREAGFDVRLPAFWACENYKGQWFVIRGDAMADGLLVACYEPTHPDPKGAAAAEAARLNG